VAPFLAALAPAAHAQPTCGDVMVTFRVGATDAEIAAATAPGIAGCSAAQRALFRVNGPALDAAVPVPGVDLVGTWLGDDVALAVQGIVTAGQEVLRITPGADGGLVVEQFWYRVTVPGRNLPYWTVGEGYAGRLMRVEIAPDGAPGDYTVRFDRPATFDGLTFEFERSYELFVLSRLHRFDRDVTLRRAGDTLVLEGEVLTQPMRDPVPRVATYTRVEAAALDTAFLTVLFAGVSQTRYLECLVHQLSDGGGPFLDRIAPFGVSDLSAHTRAAMALWLERAALLSTLRDDPTEAELARFGVLSDAIGAQRETPNGAAVRAAFAADDLCAWT